ncbi:hypothetical protein ACMU_02190 [Actibacterium mucosum KCTC 23349]|uniref:DUF6468 domain-containing protein n=1 Tax=Actibacterium mucosum KCTC 23349 TaxID=1454373 RepID=A0A037ZR55_9RHOB|nr:DUF6468 domain-containing protein [Actibacterium mucosum]KAJ57332.1 hypothetical protein ACMU_02190 [Actibacterium mucosum KCTC 23349]
MELIADILMVAGALGAAFYCMVLSRRLRRFNSLEKGMGGAIATLSAQVDDMTRALEGARSTASDSSSSLIAMTERAESVSQRLELLVASLHDLPIEKPQTPAKKETPKGKPPKEDPPAAFLRSRAADPLILRNGERGQP